MSEANKEEVEKCKTIAINALESGDADKAIRFLQKAKRMCPEDSSIDALLAKAASGGASPGASGGAAGSDGPRFRAHAATSNDKASSSTKGATRTNKDGHQYTTEQMQLVQRMLRTKDYYDILEVEKGSNEEAVKKAYKKLALKLHPDKNHAPGAEEAFKKLSKAVQCLTDPDKKHVYDRYGDEERIPTSQRQAYQQDFMNADDLFSAFFGGGATFHHHHHHAGRQRQQPQASNEQVQRAQLFQALPVLLLVMLTMASNLVSKDSGSRFSFSATSQYRNERTTPALGVSYYVTDDFEESYPDGTRALAEFDRQVEIYHVRNLGSECDLQDKQMYKKVLQAKRRGIQDEIQQARNSPKPACKDLEKVKNKFPQIYRSAMYMGAY